MKIGKFEIEEKIAPLVQMLNATEMVRTISSCQGHPGEYEVRPDRPDVPKSDVARVLFEPADGVSEHDVELFINYCILWFQQKHSFDPVTLNARKNYISEFDRSEPRWNMEFSFTPFTPYDSSAKKRYDLDTAIQQLTEIIGVWKMDYALASVAFGVANQ